MMLGAEEVIALDRLDEALRLALALGPELFCKIIDGERHAAGVRPTPDRMI